MKRLIPTLLFLGFACVFACNKNESVHDHSTDHPKGHDHHEDGHGHGDEEMHNLTLWSEEYELFLEHPTAVVGQKTPILMHVTNLADFQPLEEARLTLTLAGPTPLVGEAYAAKRPGIFNIDVTPTKAGSYTGVLRVHRSDAQTPDEITGISLQVVATEDTRQEPTEQDDHAGVIEFLKEQQWRVPFATEFAKTGTIFETIEVAGRVATPPTGTAEVGAPVPGRIAEPPGGLLPPGSEVRKGQLLASLFPAPSSPEDASQMALRVVEAKARLSAADKALERAKRLIRDEAISKRQLEDAQREQEIARESVRAAQRAVALYRGSRSESWPLRAPKSGILVEVKATPGSSVEQGQTLFRIIDTNKLWLIARIPEQDAARLKTDRSVSYRIAGLDEWQTIHVDEHDANSAVVMVGRTVDRRTRTVEVIYAINEAHHELRVGGLVHLQLPTKSEFQGVIIPRSALVETGGTHAVYVQVDGEHFEERGVRKGPRGGVHVAIESGLKAGERIVTRGAHLVRLADRASDTQAHGHIH